MTDTMTAEEYRKLATQPSHKYYNKPSDYNGVRYHSKAEAEFAANLDIRKRSGEVWFWLRQVPFDLPGRTVHRVDFLVIYSSLQWELIEVKGRDTPMGRLKRRQVEQIYGVEITVVR